MDKILLVEDSESIVEGLLPSLQLNHFAVTHAWNLKEGRKQASQGGFSLAILDLNLPDGNGLDLCSELHDAFPGLPIIILTARDDEKVAVEGFSRGAIDYVRKPFGPQELMARIRRALGRDVSTGGEIRYGKLALHPMMRTASYGNLSLDLTAREFDILSLLMRRPGGVLTRDQVLSFVDEDARTADRSLDSYFSHLRRKLREASGDKLKIRAVYGLGYRLEGE
jgi:two-component system, OmpR family, catabolic regulation response regulator CreB